MKLALEIFGYENYKDQCAKQKRVSGVGNTKVGTDRKMERMCYTST
jgi:hypothetical protein